MVLLPNMVLQVQDLKANRATWRGFDFTEDDLYDSEGRLVRAGTGQKYRAHFWSTVGGDNPIPGSPPAVANLPPGAEQVTSADMVAPGGGRKRPSALDVWLTPQHYPGIQLYESQQLTRLSTCLIWATLLDARSLPTTVLALTVVRQVRERVRRDHCDDPPSEDLWTGQPDGARRCRLWRRPGDHDQQPAKGNAITADACPARRTHEHGGRMPSTADACPARRTQCMHSSLTLR